MSAAPGPDRVDGPAAALAELLAGNERFRTGAPVRPHQNAEYRASLAAAQAPFAVLLGCSDSRLAAEIIFDRGLGDLFVVRTAGHTVGPEVLGSIEYGVCVLQAPLVVVLGHESCGAVQAAVDAVETGTRPPGHIGAVVDGVVPSVRLARERELVDLDSVVDVHVQRTVDLLRQGSAALAAALDAGRCAVAGMSYRLAEGQVRLVPAGDALSADPYVTR